MSPDLATSVKARLLNRAKAEEEELELTLVRYVCERFLYRLGASDLRDRFIVKGAALLTLWLDEPFQATRDLDLLAFDGSAAGIRAAMEAICRIPCAEDALRFDLDSLTVSPLQAEEKYTGQRALLFVYLGKARIRLQVDFGFGEATKPGPREVTYPTLLDTMPAPELRAYAPAASIAEKFEAMISLGFRNSRMKDFHDIWGLSGSLAFEGLELRAAVTECFENRGTAWSRELPLPLRTEFYSHDDLRSRWAAYHRTVVTRSPLPTEFGAIGRRVQTFFGPVRQSIVSHEPFARQWPPGGPWQPSMAEGSHDA